MLLKMITTTTTAVITIFLSAVLRIALSDDEGGGPPLAPATEGPSTVTLVDDNDETTTFTGPDATDDGGKEEERPGTIGGHVFDSGTLLRTSYVFIGVALIVVAYFVVRSLRLRCRKNRKMKYGILATNDDAFEMRHLEEDDEEDATVFDKTLSHSRR